MESTDIPTDIQMPLSVSLSKGWDVILFAKLMVRLLTVFNSLYHTVINYYELLLDYYYYESSTAKSIIGYLCFTRFFTRVCLDDLQNSNHDAIGWYPDRQTPLFYIWSYPQNWGWPDSPNICDLNETRLAQKRGFSGAEIFYKEHALAYPKPQFYTTFIKNCGRGERLWAATS